MHINTARVRRKVRLNEKRFSVLLAMHWKSFELQKQCARTMKQTRLCNEYSQTQVWSFDVDPHGIFWLIIQLDQVPIIDKVDTIMSG